MHEEEVIHESKVKSWGNWMKESLRSTEFREFWREIRNAGVYSDAF
jgi:hypothetical protein